MCSTVGAESKVGKREACFPLVPLYASWMDNSDACDKTIASAGVGLAIGRTDVRQAVGTLHLAASLAFRGSQAQSMRQAHGADSAPSGSDLSWAMPDTCI